MKAVFFTLMAIVLLSTPAYSQTPNDLVLEYIELSKIKETFDLTIQTYVDQAMAENPSADRSQLLEQFNKIMGWETLKEQSLSLILQAYKPEDLKAIIKFLKTDAGKTFAEKSPWLSGEISKLIMANLSKVKVENSDLTKQLMAIANETNKNLPMTIDEQTRLDNTMGMDGEFTYKYTLTQLTAEEISAERLENALRANLVNSYCTIEEMRFFRDNKVKINYLYSGKNGKQITSIGITLSDCPG